MSRPGPPERGPCPRTVMVDRKTIDFPLLPSIHETRTVKADVCGGSPPPRGGGGKTDEVGSILLVTDHMMPEGPRSKTRASESPV